MYFPKKCSFMWRKPGHGCKSNRPFVPSCIQSILLSVIIILLGQLLLIKSSDAVSSSSTKRGQRLSQSHFEFSLLLYRAILETNSSIGIQTSSFRNKNDNLVYSPYLVNSAMALLFLGTNSASSTSNQFRKVLGYRNISYVDVHNAFKEIIVNFGGRYYRRKMQAAIGLFVKKGAFVTPTYARALREFYHANLEAIEYRNADIGQTMGTINEWASEEIEGSIQSYENDEEGGVNWKAPLLNNPPQRNSSIVLGNLIALEARWLYPFDPDETFTKGLFFLPNNKRLEVPMMSGRFELPHGYSSELECQVLEMPFSQRRISMFLLLPDNPTAEGILQLESNMTSDNVKLLFSTLKTEIVNVRMPRFQIGSDTGPCVQDALKSIGLTDIFDKNKSDLSLMAPNHALYLTSIAHRATFVVTEKGAKGRRTVVDGKKIKPNRFGPFGQKYFEVDHPFIFMVWDYYSGMFILMGRVMHPNIIPS